MRSNFVHHTPQDQDNVDGFFAGLLTSGALYLKAALDRIVSKITGLTLDQISAGSTNVHFTTTDKAKLDNLVDNYKGNHTTGAALASAHPTGQAGWWAIVNNTDTVWIWDTDTNAWIDSDKYAPAIEVINLLTSTSTTAALSAAQGKVLKDLIDAIQQPNWNASSGFAQIQNKPTMIFSPLVFTKDTVVDGELLRPFGVPSITSFADYDNYFPIPLSHNFHVRHIFVRLKGPPSVQGKVQVTIKSHETTDNQIVLQSGTWQTNAASLLQMFNLVTPFVPDTGPTISGYNNLLIKINKIDGLTVDITNALVVVYLEPKTD